MFERKQNVFDDFIAAAEWLDASGWSTPEEDRDRRGQQRRACSPAAVMVQRPDLFGAVVCRVPVADMLRYHLFTVGRFWISEYGSADDPEQFPFLYQYSPLHNVKDGVAYPPILITTADTDDRVVARHGQEVRRAAAGGRRRRLPRPDPRRDEGRARRGKAGLEDDRRGRRHLCVPVQVSWEWSRRAVLGSLGSWFFVLSFSFVSFSFVRRRREATCRGNCRVPRDNGCSAWRESPWPAVSALADAPGAHGVQRDQHATPTSSRSWTAAAKAAPKLIHLTTFGTSSEGRTLPLAVIGAPDASPEAVRAHRQAARLHPGQHPRRRSRRQGIARRCCCASWPRANTPTGCSSMVLLDRADLQRRRQRAVRPDQPRPAARADGRAGAAAERAGLRPEPRPHEARLAGGARRS